MDNRTAIRSGWRSIRSPMRLTCLLVACAPLVQSAEPGNAFLPVVQPATPLGRETAPAPLQLTAIGPVTSTDRTLTLRGGAETPLTFVWVLQQSKRDPVMVWFELANEWCSTTQLAVLDPTRWTYGGAYNVDAVIAPPAISVCGRGSLCVRVQRGGDIEPIEVGRVPCWIEPQAAASAVHAEKARQRFGADATILGKACRLFPGTSLQVDIPDRAEAFRGIGIISALRFSGAFTQGEPVLEISADNGQFAPLHVLAGVHTSVGEFDAARPGVLKVNKAEVFSTLPYPGVSWEEAALRLVQYVAVLPLERPANASRLRLTYTGRTGAIDIFELALVRSLPDGSR